MGKLEKRVAIVTGGGTGIGENIALEFAKEGADVVVTSRNIANLKKVSQKIEAFGRRSLAIAADVTVMEQVQSMVKKTTNEFGKIDILVNNAGLVRRVSLLDMSEEDWDIVIDTNLKGVFLCTQAVAEYMMKGGYGKIINISSVAGRGGAFSELGSYAAAKSGVIQLTKSYALLLGPYGINVNAIAPGAVITPLTYVQRTPHQVQQFIDDAKRLAVLGKIGSPQDITNLALFLASDASSFITGETIAIDGGRKDRM